MIHRILTALFSLAAVNAVAASPTFEDLSKQDFKGVIKDFSGVFAHTSVSPAASLGKIFGVEVGIVAGAAQTPKVKELAREADPNSNVMMLPNAGALLAVSAPLGLTVEAVVMPESEFSDVTVSNTALAVKWTFSDVFEMPFDMAFKVHHAASALEFQGLVSGVKTNFDYESEVSGALFQISRKLTIFEPYAGAGVVKSTGTMKVDSTAVFDPSYTVGNKAEEKMTGGHFMVGANFNLLIMKFGIEVGRVFDATKAAAKVSFYF